MNDGLHINPFGKGRGAPDIRLAPRREAGDTERSKSKGAKRPTRRGQCRALRALAMNA
jgi:hypothetical protein